MSDAQFAAYEAKCAASARLGAEILPHNKLVRFDALAAAGINVVTISFDGCGDSGQFDAPVGDDAENREVAIPTVDITVKSVDFDTGTVSERTTTEIDVSIRPAASHDPKSARGGEARGEIVGASRRWVARATHPTSPVNAATFAAKTGVPLPDGRVFCSIGFVPGHGPSLVLLQSKRIVTGEADQPPECA